MILKIENIVTKKEAIEFNGENFEECREFMETGGFSDHSRNYRDQVIRIHTLEGTMIVNKGDYIIKGLQGTA